MFTFKNTQRLDGPDDAWGNDGPDEVHYNDGGLQEQLLKNLQSSKVKSRRPTAPQDARRTPATVHPAWNRDDFSPSPSPPADEAVHNLLGDLQQLTQAALGQQEHHHDAEPMQKEQAGCGMLQEQGAQLQPANQQAHALGGKQQSCTEAVLTNNRNMLAQLLHGQQPCQQQQQQQAATTPMNAAWQNKQQQQHNPQQRQQQQHRTPASMGQLLASQHAVAAGKQQQPQQQQQQRRKSILYSTPQHPAPKKKAKFSFSIKETPPATGYATPQGQPRQRAAAGVVAGSNSNAMAALLGNSAVTSARQREAAAGGAAPAATVAGTDPSRTPHGRPQIVAGPFATPRFSTTKASRLKAGAQASPAHTTPVAAAGGADAGTGLQDSSSKDRMDVDGGAAAAAAVADELAGPVVPAALFSEDEGNAAAAAAAAASGVQAAAQGSAPSAAEARHRQQQQGDAGAQHPAAAAGGSNVVTPASNAKQGKGRRRSTVDPLALLSEQHERQKHFLSALPAAARTPGGSNLSTALSQMGGRGVAVPAGSSLSKVMLQVQAAQKEQQEALEQQLAAGRARGLAGSAIGGQATGLLELEVVSKSWEAHMVKCLCRIRQYQQQQQQPEPQQQQHKPGELAFLFVQSKTGHAVDLNPGGRVRVHAPWYEVVQQQPGQPPVLLAYLISTAT